MKYQALIFDLDDTLVVERDAAEAAFLDTGQILKERHGIDPQVFCRTIWETCRTFWHQSPVREYCREIGISSREALWATFAGRDKNLEILRQWAPEYRFNSWTTALKKHGIEDEKLAGELADLFVFYRQQRHLLFEDVLSSIIHFKNSFKLAILTNGVPDLQWQKIKGAGIESYFDAIVISGEVGIGKPDPRIFTLILSQLNVPPQKALMIGDSLKSDILGAQASGIKAVWLKRNSLAVAGDIIPDIELHTLDELKKALENNSL